MIELGKFQKLEVLRETKIGLYLNFKKGEERDTDILLPNNQIPEDIKIGDLIDVFIYKDSEDRIIATRKKPYITLDEISRLKVIETNRVGVFLDWGLEKDLFLPFKEQKYPLNEGDYCLVCLYIDNSDRLCATMDIHDKLLSGNEFSTNKIVNGTVYDRLEDGSFLVAVENKFDAIIPKKEIFGDIKLGQIIEARVKLIRQNGKIELSIRKNIFQQIDIDSDIIINILNKNGGKLLLSDSSSPEQIKKELNMSKSQYKRAIGRLYKQRRIEIVENGIKLIKK